MVLRLVRKEIKVAETSQVREETGSSVLGADSAPQTDPITPTVPPVSRAAQSSPTSPAPELSCCPQMPAHPTPS